MPLTAAPAAGRPDRPRTAPPAPEPRAAVEQLLAGMASVRRITRRTVARPAVLSTLTGSQQELVFLVRRRPDVSVAEAADELRLAANTVSTLVRQLCDAGYLVRRADPEDRRVARLALVPKISHQVTAWRDRRVDAIAAAMATLAAADRRVLFAVGPALDRLADALPLQDARP